MIFTLITDFFVAVISLLTSLLPTTQTVPLPAGVTAAITTMTQYFLDANAFFPMNTLFSIIGIALSIEAGILLFKIANWVYDKIRGAG